MKCLRNCWTDLRQIHMEDVFGPSLGQVLRSKFKVTRDEKWHFWPFRWPACSLYFIKHLSPLVTFVLMWLRLFASAYLLPYSICDCLNSQKFLLKILGNRNAAFMSPVFWDFYLHALWVKFTSLWTLMLLFVTVNFCVVLKSSCADFILHLLLVWRFNSTKLIIVSSDAFV